MSTGLRGWVWTVSYLHERVRWVLNDAAFKAPETVSEVAWRWIEVLQEAIEQDPGEEVE